ncbi:hypothetical protein V8G54_030957 [Vigna mungo]|uniref:Pentatricopeptide repeat-containing protein n=1 Tax=Vigna mungo TaxID=3915 RepID=A0AAQ3MXH0_VIGMU
MSLEFCQLFMIWISSYSLCKRKHLKQAEQLFGEVKNCLSLSAETYSFLTSGWGKIDDSDKARKMLVAMNEQGCPVDLLAYYNLLGALCKVVRVDEAKRVLHDMLLKRVEPDAFII